MPVCAKCGKQQASAELRRYRERWYCKDRYPCKHRILLARAESRSKDSGVVEIPPRTVSAS